MDRIDERNTWPIDIMIEQLLDGVIFMNTNKREEYYRKQKHEEDLLWAGKLCKARKEELEIAEHRLIDAIVHNHKRRGGRYPYYLIGKMNAVVNANKAYGQAQEEYSKIYYEKY